MSSARMRFRNILSQCLLCSVRLKPDATKSDGGRDRHMATKHPPGLYVLFFTELWERYSFYSMMAILSLYMNESLHFDVAHVGQRLRRCTRRASTSCPSPAACWPIAARFQPGDHRGRRVDDARPSRAGRRSAALLLLRARAAGVRQRAAQAERVDARRQPLPRSSGTARPGLQHLLHGREHRRLRVAAARWRGCARTTAGASRSCRQRSRCSSRSSRS